MSRYLIAGEINALTKRLYAEGYTRENHPDTVYWSDFQNLGYKWETMLGFTWETPCGLLIQGESDIGRGLASEAQHGFPFVPKVLKIAPVNSIRMILSGISFRIQPPGQSVDLIDD